MEQLPSAAPDFFSEVRSILAAARARAVTAVNTAMVEAYWLIGKRIVEEEQQGQAKATYGVRLLEELSRHLGDHLGKGFSVANLRNFRQFHLTYPDPSGIHYTLCSELSWSHNRLIMREDDEVAQLYYLKQAKLENWTVRQLQRQLKTRSYQRLLASREASPAPPAPTSGPDIRSLIKDPYVLEFLQLPEPHDEANVESAIISQLQQFQTAIGRCASGDLAASAKILFETLGYRSDRTAPWTLESFLELDGQGSRPLSANDKLELRKIKSLHLIFQIGDAWSKLPVAGSPPSGSRPRGRSSNCSTRRAEA